MHSSFNVKARLCSVALCAGAAAALAVPSGNHAATPTAQVRPVRIGGIVSVITLDDLVRGTLVLEYQLEDAQSHRHFALHFAGAPPKALRSGTYWEVSGLAGIGANVLNVSSATPLTMSTTASTAAPLVSGVQNTLVIITNFLDASVASTPGQIQDIMFTAPNGASIDALFRETSFGNVSFSGKVVGPFVINYTTASACDIGGWADAADAAATAAGNDLTAYPRRLYVMPNTAVSACAAVGAGQLGGSPTRAWVFQETVGEVYAHELGHNLNMNHASTLANEYGDASDDMSAGGYPLRHFNAPHMEQMGWMPSSNILTVTQSGTYTIAALEFSPTQAPAPQILKVLKPDTGDYYYFSYRAPIGFDSSLLSTYWNRVSVHKYVGTYSAYRTYLLALLGDAGAFSDSTNGITVTQLSHTSDYATVQVQLPAGSSATTCQSATPALALSPSSQSGYAGNTLSYVVSLTNKDNAYCSASTFALAGAVPSGWSGSVSPATLSLAPGATGAATLAVTSATTTAAATYSATLNTSDAATATHAVSASVAYVVQTVVCARYAPAVVFSPTSLGGYAGSSQSYTVAITNRDSSSCAASTLSIGDVIPAGWSASLSPTTMSLSPGATSGATFVVTSPPSAAVATYTVQVNTTDAATTAHSASGSASDVVQADTQAPSAPASLTASVTKRTKVSLAWRAATDNIAVSGYEVWRNGARVATTATTGYAETLSNGTYTYYVVAYDAAGNRSGASNAVSVTIKSK